jgi:hypothetical protein
MPRTRQQAIADHIAARVLANSRKRFSSLYEAALEEYSMSEVRATQHGVNKSGPMTNPQSMAVTSQVTVEVPLPQHGADKTTSNAHPANMPPNPAVRAENNDAEGA